MYKDSFIVLQDLSLVFFMMLLPLLLLAVLSYHHDLDTTGNPSLSQHPTSPINSNICHYMSMTNTYWHRRTLFYSNSTASFQLVILSRDVHPNPGQVYQDPFCFDYHERSLDSLLFNLFRHVDDIASTFEMLTVSWINLYTFILLWTQKTLT